LNLKGFKPLRKNSINSPKFFLDMVFNTVNLDGLTCFKKFEAPLQVANRDLKREIQKESNLTLNPLELVFTVASIIEAL
jgi:hypothetical protein